KQVMLTVTTPITIAKDGLEPADLERVIVESGRAGERIKLLYTVPNFNNPTAALLSLERREKIAELCRAAGILIVQDDAFADLSLGPELPLSFWSIMGGEGVAILGTFSKTLAPGLRLNRLKLNSSRTTVRTSGDVNVSKAS